MTRSPNASFLGFHDWEANSNKDDEGERAFDMTLEGDRVALSGSQGAWCDGNDGCEQGKAFGIVFDKGAAFQMTGSGGNAEPVYTMTFGDPSRVDHGTAVALDSIDRLIMGAQVSTDPVDLGGGNQQAGEDGIIWYSPTP